MVRIGDGERRELLAVLGVGYLSLAMNTSTGISAAELSSGFGAVDRTAEAFCCVAKELPR